VPAGPKGTRATVAKPTRGPADRAKIEKPLRELPIGKSLTVLRFDEDFHLVPAK
jgi:hypothetical protein